MLPSEAIEQALEDFERWRDDPREVWGIPTGLPSLDRQTGGLHDGELTIIAAAPNTGKSGLIGKAAKTAARSFMGSRKWAFVFSNEMLEKQYWGRLIVQEAGVPHKLVRTGRADLTPLRQAAKELDSLPLEVAYREGWNFESILAHLRQAAEEGRFPGIVFLDYIQNVDGGDQDQRRVSIGTLAKQLADFARKKSLPVVVAAQINREGTKAEQPQNHHLADSSQLEKAADNIWLVWRPDMGSAEKDQGAPQEALVFVSKVRNNGERGLVRLVFHPKTGRFRDMEEENIGGGIGLHRGESGGDVPEPAGGLVEGTEADGERAEGEDTQGLPDLGAPGRRRPARKRGSEPADSHF